MSKVCAFWAGAMFAAMLFAAAGGNTWLAVSNGALMLTMLFIARATK